MKRTNRTWIICIVKDLCRGAKSIFGLFCVILTTTAGPAAADRPAPPKTEQKETFDTLVGEGLEYYSARQYEKAVERFKLAIEIQEEPELLYNIARSYERLAKSEEALKWYQRLLETPGTTSELRSKALTNQTALRQEISAQKAAQQLEQAEGENRNGAPRDPTVDGDESATGAQRDTKVANDGSGDETAMSPKDNVKKSEQLKLTGWILTGVGVAGGVTGAIFGGLTLKAENDYEAAGIEPARIQYREDVERNALIFDIAFISGAALTATGVTLLVINYIKQRPEREQSASRQRMRILPSFAVDQEMFACGLRGHF